MVIEKIGVMIATPMRSFDGKPESVPPAVRKMLKALADHPVAREHYRFDWIAACGGIARARNNCVHEFLKAEDGGEKWPWILWRDGDLEEDGNPAETVLRLLSHKQPVVGGLYPKRTPGKRPVWAATWLPAAELQPEADGLLQVAELAIGYQLHHRKVYTELRRLMPNLVYRERETGEMIAGYFQQLVLDVDLLSEDYFFDYVLRCCKIPILADTKVRLRHRDPDGTLYPASSWPPIPAELIAETTNAN